MTLDEAERLRPGDRVEVKMTSGGMTRWVPARVTNADLNHASARGGRRSWLSVHAIVEGVNSSGRKYLCNVHRGMPVPCGGPGKVRLAPDLPPAAANVYADWLDDRGEHRAAAMLREAFPLAPEGRAG